MRAKGALQAAGVFQDARALAREHGFLHVEPLFETRIDYLDRRVGLDQPNRLSARSSLGGWDGAHPANRDWALERVAARAAWQLSGPHQAAGQGVVIGHPDTGYSHHPELFSLDPAQSRLLIEHGHDFLDGDPDAEDDLRDDLFEFDLPGHGTATGSVAVSAYGVGSVTGVAHQARLIPLRVSESVIHFSFIRVIRAIRHAVDAGAHVISMSLGGPYPTRALRMAVEYATERGVIVVAAAGNVYPPVVYPAALDEVIAVAASNVDDRPWWLSAQGPEVDITAPGENVLCASIEPGAPNPFVVGPSSGTSFATAMTAGAAALWLAHHGVDMLRARYPGRDLQRAFREVLRRSARRPASWDSRNLGPGILDAEGVLRVDLPEAHDLQPTLAAAQPYRPEPPHGRLDRLLAPAQARVRHPSPTRLAALHRGVDALDELSMAELELQLALSAPLRSAITENLETETTAYARADLQSLANELSEPTRRALALDGAPPRAEPYEPTGLAYRAGAAAGRSHRITLGGNGDVTFALAAGVVGGNPLIDTPLAIVSLEELVISELFSRDGWTTSIRNRQGVLTVAINGVPTTLSWATDDDGKLKNADKFKRFVFFLGEHCGSLRFEVELFELDPKGGFLADLGKAVSAFAPVAALVPGAGAAVAAASGLVGSALQAVTNSKGSRDPELLFRGGLGNGIDGRSGVTVGSWRVSRGNGVSLTFAVHPFHTAAEGDPVRLLLEEIEVDVPDDVWKADGELIVELTLGYGKCAKRFSLKQRLETGGRKLSDFSGISNHVLFEGPFHRGLPFHLSVAVVTKAEELAALEKVTDSVGGFIGHVGDLDDDTEAGVTKALQSMRSLVMEFLPGKKSLGTLSGILCPPECLAGTASIGPERSKVVSVAPGETTTLSFEMSTGGRGHLKLGLVKA